MADKVTATINATASGSEAARALLPFMAPEIEHDAAIAAALANALFPQLLTRMILYFRSNPPAAAPSPVNPFKF